MNLTLRQYQSINNIAQENWDRLNKEQNPFLQHCFLSALENSGCVSEKTGWRIAHLGWLDSDGELQAVIPQYIKSHSYGEYLFDWDWAHSLNQAGIRYYPKSVSAIPFTPVTGARLMVSEQYQAHKPDLIKQLFSTIEEQQLSNFQCLFLNKNELNDWQNAGAMIREGHQFSWYNAQYNSFADFLNKLRSSARKKIRRERRNIAESDITFVCTEHTDIDDHIWSFFIQCYQQTYLKRSGHTGYLNASFFQQLRQTMSDKLVVITAYRNEQPIAASLFIKGNDMLYGRYWGTMEVVDGLHFECCYYQGIEYCIKEKINCLQPGTQGDYKRRRGFVAEHIYGAYYFTLDGLQQPIQDYLDLESKHIKEKFENWSLSSPYK